MGMTAKYFKSFASFQNCHLVVVQLQCFETMGTATSDMPNSVSYMVTWFLLLDLDLDP